MRRLIKINTSVLGKENNILKLLIFKHILFLMILTFVVCNPINIFATTYKPIRNDDILKNRFVERDIKRFLRRERSFIQRGLNNMTYYLDMVENVFSDYNLPHDLIYLPLIESAYSPRAFSRAGAAGIWQFMPDTGRAYGLRINFWIDERRDPEKSTIAAAKHLKGLYGFYKDWNLALAAYNAGMGSINWAIKRSKSRDIWKLISQGYLNRETAEYVPRFFAAVAIAKNYNNYGFKFNEKSNDEMDFMNSRKIKLNYPIDLTILSRKSGLSLKQLMFMNPELRRYITPPVKSYEIRIPNDYYALVFSVYHNIPPQELIDVREYIVRTGETLGGIASIFETNQTLICRLNGIRNPKRIYAGQKLLIPINKRNKNIDLNYTSYRIPKKGFLTQEINYTIKKGDNLWVIAKKYQTTIEELLAVNGLNFDSILLPGDRIKIWVDLLLTR